MDLRLLRYFVTVADSHSFTRAAEVLGMAQPPLSQQIKRLEEELGVVLFRRLTRGVELTATGTILLEQARDILARQQKFLSSAAELARGHSGQLRIGVAGAVALVPSFAVAVRAFRQRFPDVEISLDQSNTPALSKALHDRSIDAAIVRPPVPNREGLIVQSLINERTLIALPRSHALSKQACLTLDQIAQDELIIFPRDLGPGFYDAILAACEQAGFTPKLGQKAPQIASMVSMVSADLGVSIVPESLGQIAAEGVTFHQILGAQPVAQIAIATRSAHRSALLTHFISVLRTICQKDEAVE